MSGALGTCARGFTREANSLGARREKGPGSIKASDCIADANPGII